jgi:hypothetical protein
MYDSNVNFYIVFTSIFCHKYEEMAADRYENIGCPIYHCKIKKHGYEVVLNGEQAGYRQGTYVSTYAMHGCPSTSIFQEKA